MSLPRGIRYVSAPPGDGYGNSAQGYLTVLEQLDVAVAWEPVGAGHEGRPRVSRDESRFTDRVDRRVRHDTVIVHLPADRIPPQLTKAGRRLKVALTTAEADAIPSRWVDDLDSVDRVIVPSTFNRDVFAACGVRRPMWVVPHVSTLPTGAAPFDHPALGSRFVFYAMGPWTTRKGLAETVVAFADAFAGNDEVALVIKTGLIDHQAEFEAQRSAGSQAAGPDRLETWWSLAQLLATRPSAPPVLLITDRWTDSQVAALHARGDCLISLYRGEGFGIPVLDAGRYANPVVITGWSAPVEIVDPSYPLLVDHRLISTTADRIDTWMRPDPTQHWAEVDHDDAVDKLRWVFDHREPARALGGQLAERAEARCGMAAVGAALAAALDR